jgi:hypothetical protein
MIINHLIMSKAGGLGSKVRKHLGMFLLLLGILLFLGSLLGLANTLVWPRESLPYRLGNFLVQVSIVIIIAGCVIGVRGLMRRSREEKEVSEARSAMGTALSEEQARERARAIAAFYKELVAAGVKEDVAMELARSQFISPAEPIKVRATEERKREILFSGKIRLVRILLGVMILLFAILPVIIFPLSIIFPLIVSIYLIKSKKSRLFSEAILMFLSIPLFIGLPEIPLITAGPALLLKRFLPVTGLDELFFIMLYATSTLTLTGTIFVFTVSLVKRSKRISSKTSSVIVLASTLLPFTIVMLAPTQPSPGPMISASMSSKSGVGNMLAWGFSSGSYPGFLEYDETSGLWIYRISLASLLQNKTIINRVSFDSEILNAPFGENIGCEGLEKTVEGIVFQPGAEGQIIITLNKAFNKITLFDNNGNIYRLIW